eukprot:403342198
MQLLQQTFINLEQDKNSQPQALELNELLGLQKENRRKVKNLAEFLKQDRNQTKEELIREQQQAVEFLNKISQDKSEHRKQMERIQKKKQDQIRELEEKQKEEEEQKRIQNHKEKTLQVLKLKDELKLKEQQRKQINLETEVKVYEILNAKPLYKKKEEKFKEDQEKDFQDRQDDYIRLVKGQHQAVELKELEEHRVKYLEAKRFKELQLQKQRNNFMDSVQEKARLDDKRLRQKYGNQSPKALQLCEREIQEREEQEREKEEMRKKMQERVQNYSHYV